MPIARSVSAIASVALVVIVTLGFGALAGCAPIPLPTIKTHVERTTVVVRDPAGNVTRIEEKEQVLQEYNSDVPMDLKTTKAPPVKRP